MSKVNFGPFSDSSSRQLIKRLLSENFRKYIKRYLLAFLLMGCVAAATGASVFLMKNITKVVFGNSAETAQAAAPLATPAGLDPSVEEKLSDFNSRFLQWFSFSDHPGLLQLFYVSMAIIVVFFIKGFADYGSTVILSKIGNNIVAHQQYRISDHVMKQSLAFFVRFPSSDLLGRTGYAANSARVVMNLLINSVQDVLIALALLAAMFVLDWRLSFGTLIIMAPVVFLLGNILKRIRKITNAQFQSSIKVVSATQEAILGNKLIKIYNLQSLMLRRFAATIGEVEQRSNKMARISARTSPTMEVIGGLAIAVIVFYGGYRNIVHGQGAESLIAFLAALLMAYGPIKRLAKLNVSLQSSLVGVELLYKLLDSDYTLPDPPEAKPLNLTKGGIQIKDVTFGYRPELNVVHNITLDCPGGEVTALVGPSGSGKTTLLGLIEHFYPIKKGSIAIDGQDISHITTESLRAEISLVSQDTFLFSDTIRNNILFARPEASPGEVEAAARAAYAHDFILEQPQGYETEVGENGGSLSGGQRQRISIARAFLKNAPILLLDEATSALDSESEQQIQKAFDHLMQGRTTIVIAHRFSTIRNAATIHVMQDGRLVASGSHQQLIEDERSLYAHLYGLQYNKDV